MTPEQRLDRAERILVMMAKIGRQTRREWRDKLNILIDMQIRNEEERKVASREQDEKINILIHTQTETTEQIKALSLSQQKTDEALRAFLDRSRRRNGHS